MTRNDFQLIVTKLDLNAITLKDAKAYAKRFGANATGRTKEQFIRNLKAFIV